MVSDLPLGMPESLRMRPWRCGGGEEGSEEEGKVQSQDAPHMDRGLGYEHQQSAYNICEIHVHGGSRSRSRHMVWASQGKIVSHRALNDT